MKELLILTPPVELLSTPRKTERHDQSKLKILYIQYSRKTGEKIEVEKRRISSYLFTFSQHLFVAFIVLKLE